MWDRGSLYAVYRRALIEDELAALDSIATAASPAEIKARASARLQLCRAASDGDSALGLSPRAVAQLRWSIAPDEPEQRSASAPEPKPDAPDQDLYLPALPAKPARRRSDG